MPPGNTQNQVSEPTPMPAVPVETQGEVVVSAMDSTPSPVSHEAPVSPAVEVDMPVVPDTTTSEIVANSAPAEIPEIPQENSVPEMPQNIEEIPPVTEASILSSEPVL